MTLFFLIADLAGYTALTEAHGGLEAAKVVDRYVELAEQALVSGVRLVERVGDELLIAGDDAASVVETAVRLRDGIEAEPLFPDLRCGIHGGAIVEQRGRYFGAPLNLTARIAAYARPGQILCSDAVATACSGDRRWECRSIGPVRFRNVPADVAVFEIVTTGGGDRDVLIDPVCRMQVRPDTAAARITVGGRTRYFCSLACANAFAESPENYPDS